MVEHRQIKHLFFKISIEYSHCQQYPVKINDYLFANQKHINLLR